MPNCGREGSSPSLRTSLTDAKPMYITGSNKLVKLDRNLIAAFVAFLQFLSEETQLADSGLCIRVLQLLPDPLDIIW